MTMPRTPEEARRIIRALIQREVIRAALGAAVLSLLVLVGYQFVAAFALALATYVGLWLLSDSKSSPGANPHEPSYRDVREAFARCLQLQIHIESTATSIADPRIADRALGISSWAERISDALADEEKLEASLTLLAPLVRADEILSRYTRLVRRGLDSAEVQDRVHAYLTTIDQTLAGFWTQLSEQAVLDLDELGDKIESTLDELPAELPSLQPRLPADAGASFTPEARTLIESLTPRELEVLRQLPTGRTDQEIAEALFISKRTISDHVTNLCAKLGVRNRTEAAAFAARNGLGPVDPEPSSPA